MTVYAALPISRDLSTWTDSELERRLDSVGFALALTSLSHRRAELMDESARIMREQERRGTRAHA